MASLDDLKKQVADATAAIQNAASPEALSRIANDTLKALRGDAGSARKGEYSAGDETPAEILKYADTPEDFICHKCDGEDSEIAGFKKWQDEVLILSALLTQKDPTNPAGTVRVNPRTLKTWKRGERKYGRLIKAMSAGTATSGYEWVPTLFSSNLIDTFHLEQRVEALFPAIDPMPSSPYTLPYVVGDGSVKLLSESTTSDPDKITEDTPTTGNLTLTAVKLGIRERFSEEMDEDSIIPVMPFLRQKLVQTMNFGIEDALINGDTSTTHRDSDVTASTDPRKSWNGLRLLAQSGNRYDVGGAQLNLTHIRTIRQYLGKYGTSPTNLAYITSPTGMIQFLSISEVITLDKYGPNATILNGEIGMIDNIPIIVSEKIRENLNASGFYDGTTTNKSMAICVFRPGFVVGTRRRITLKTWTDIETDQQVLVGTIRKDFKPLYTASTNDIVSELYNLPTALTA